MTNGAASTPMRNCCCISCNRLMPDDKTAACSVCEVDNRGWCNLTWQQRFNLFPIGAWLALLVVIGVFHWVHLLARGGWPPNQRWLIAEGETLLVGGLALGLAIAVYASRQHLRLYELRTRCCEQGLRPSLGLFAALSLVVGAGTAALADLALVSLARLIPTLTEVVAEIPPLAVAPLVFLPFLSLAIMLFGTLGYIRHIQECYPPPIFCDEERLCKVAVKALTTTYLPQQKIDDLARTPEDIEPPALRSRVAVEVESVKRNACCGLDLMVREHTTVWSRDEKTKEYIGKSETTCYDVSTDEWGGIVTLNPRKRSIRLSIYEPDTRKGK